MNGWQVFDWMLDGHFGRRAKRWAGVAFVATVIAAPAYKVGPAQVLFNAWIDWKVRVVTERVEQLVEPQLPLERGGHR